MSPEVTEVTVIGCDGRPFGAEAAQALAAARLVIGAPRHLAAVAIPPGAERMEIKHLDAALDALAARPGPIAVLASGDPGFFGIVRALRARGIEPRVIPAISSVTLAFARLGLDWDDALVVSAHGREPRGPKHALAAALAHPKAAILTAPRTATARDLGVELLAAGKRVYVAECLGTAQERVTDLAAEPAREFAEPNILIADRTLDQTTLDQAAPSTPRWLAGHQGAPDGWALPEDAFEHRDSMITKAEVRALILARLGPAPGRVIWDVGAGSGSVAVECARFGACVIAVEADRAQCDRIRQNAAHHGVHLQVRQGRAPEALNDLPPAERGLRRRRRPHRAGRRRQDRQPRPRRGHAGRRRPGGRDQRPAHRPGLPPRGRPAPGVPPGPAPERTAPPGRPEPGLRPVGAAMIGLVSVTAAGQAAADRLAQAWPDARRYDGPAGTALPQAFKECDAVVCFLAVGATVRLLAPLLKGKHDDPGVVCVDEALRFAVPVLGAHPRRRQRAGPPGRGNPGRRTGHHHGQRRRRERRRSTSSAPTWASAWSRAATWPPWAPRSCPATGSRSPHRTRSGRCPRCPRTWCARTGRNQGFPPSW